MIVPHTGGLPSGAARRGAKEGIVLILLSLLLVLLIFLAFLCTSQMASVRRMQRQVIATVRAGLLARSGVERARTGLRLGGDAAYGGEDYDGDGIWNPAPEGIERTGQSFRPAAFDVEPCPVDVALRPSFFSVADGRMAGASPAPDLLDVDGQPRGISGRLRGTHIDRAGRRGDTYALKVSVRNGLHINGGDPAVPWSEGYNLRLRSVLGTLAEAIDRSDGVNDGSPVDAADGRNLIELRPTQTGWASWEQVRDVALGSSQARLDALKPYLALESWVDRKVIASTATEITGSALRTWADYKLAHTGNGGPIPGPERLGGNVVGRAPVDLGWARRNRVVLIALMANLSGIFLDESTASARGNGAADFVGTVRSAVLSLNDAQANWAPGSPTDPCRTAADALSNFSGSLETWAQWEAFVDGIAGLTQEQRSLLKANFNPNSNLNKFNPDPSRWRPIDKSDLVAVPGGIGSTTEFSLFPVQPTEIACAGRVVDGEGLLLALRTVEASLSAPRVLRIAAQSEFVCDSLGGWDLVGDENAVPYRRPGYSVGGEAPFITQSTGNVHTWGRGIDMRGTYPGTWMDGASPFAANAPRGLSLQPYPAPYCGSPLSIAPATYDGGLRLATLEEITTAVPDMRLRASFDAQFDLDHSAAGTPQNQPDVLQPPAGNDLLQASGPGTLYPDGAYSEKGRAPTYLGLNHMHPLHGLLSFWAKPNYAWSSRGRIWTDMTNHDAVLDASNFQESLQGFWLLGAKTDPTYNASTHAGVFMEPTRSEAESDFIFGAACPLVRGWRLVTFFWDFGAGSTVPQDPHRAGEFIVNDGSGGAGIGSSYLYGALTTSWTPDPLTQDAGAGPHRIVLGWRPPYPVAMGGLVGRLPAFSGSGADATFDEYLIYDMGEDEGATLPLAQTRYQAGRYYKGWAYHAPGDQASLPSDAAPSYFSPRLSLPPGALLRQVRWTFHRPVELPNDYVEIEVVTNDGAGYYWDDDADPSDSVPARSTRASGWTADRQHWDVHRSIDDPFRLRVLFRRPVALNPVTPILDSPVLDELVVLYDLPGGSSWTAWRE